MSHSHSGLGVPGAIRPAGRHDWRTSSLTLVLSWILRLVTAAGLAVDAYMHLKVASDYDVIPGTISGGDPFRAESAAAIAVALLVLVHPGRVAYLLAFLVAASALGAVMLYTNVDVGALGPLPDLYEPVWFTEKTVSAIAEAIATVTAALGLVFEVLRRCGT
jgi:hypothetical protein